MAYIKSHTTKSGVEGNYWRITKADVNKITGKALVEVNLYVTKQSRLDGKSPLDKKSFIIPLSSIDLSKELFEECYAAIKTANECDSINPLMQGEAYFADATID